jgi:hypothetical protein
VTAGVDEAVAAAVAAAAGRLANGAALSSDAIRRSRCAAPWMLAMPGDMATVATAGGVGAADVAGGSAAELALPVASTGPSACVAASSDWSCGNKHGCWTVSSEHSELETSGNE